MTDEKLKELQMKCLIDNLKSDLKTREDYDKIFRVEAREMIINFWCWFQSPDYKRDMTKREEAEKYADNFFNDLLKEIIEN